MEGKMFWGKYLIWVMLLLGQICGSKSCIEKERNALFELKKYIISITEEGESNDFLTTWTNDTKSDCCMWKGLKCHHNSGRVIQLSISPLHLKERSLLNLSLLHPFEEVRSLDLSYSRCGGLFDDVEGYRSLRRLRNLEILDLSFNYFNNSIFPFLSAATSLTTLSLRNNEMDGSFPVEELRDLTNLELLNLGGNKFNGSIPIEEFTGLRKLKALGLSGNEFSGSIEFQGVCQLKHIEELDFSKNKLVGQFPICITSLTGLRVLDLSSNNLTGKLPSALGGLESLEYLSLFDNNFESVFSLGSLTNLSKLKVLKLGSTSNSGKVEREKYWKPKFQLSVISDSSWKPEFQLSVISLEACNLDNIPHFLLHQKDLRYVDLSDNNIYGKFPYWLLENNTKLEVLLLRNNSFRSFQLPESDHKHLLCLDVSVNEFDNLFPQNIGWILPHLKYMNLGNNGFQGNLPSSLGNMKKIEFLDISHNSFYGKLPKSFLKGCYSFRMLKMSNNKLSGENILESANFTLLFSLSMDNNLFTGKIGDGLRNSRSLSMLDMSNNSLSGVIPSWIGELPDLYALLLSHNTLEGEIPLSLFKYKSSGFDFQLVDLSQNHLSGGIPSLVNSRYPSVLLLQGNNLSGLIPDVVLVNVTVLDLRNNRLSGNIPEFINPYNISILLLRGNNLTGRIPHQLCGLGNIQLLDLSNNRLNGSVPSCLSNKSFGFGKEAKLDNSYYDSGVVSIIYFNIVFRSLIVEDQFIEYCDVDTKTKIEFVTKHRYDAYWGGNLKLLFGMDLSENELNGEIPVELGGLLTLQGLNLSHNNLSGVIPKSFAGLKNVESLDLSFNRLQGPIPPQLTDLSSLAVFNVSFNNLSGVIPEGRQFNTFDTQSYLGNPLLCGQANKISCNDITFQELDNGLEADESTTIDMESFY
ncbi:PREDICTED: receptor-like protein 12 [Camelina sativa]|uniref:Receptor-like protein 12 n=1 Tax=Camelina sativa TaxID=90675 RepID=A0ABM1R2V7_CAMSA|nr:PREDICTED: receptor-like protein 12 [Camelina sativa]